jgi:Cof subfamily protein (haloacid dehalogenase superfamily)
MNRIRLIVCDLDGTLLSEVHQITPAVKAAVEQYRSSGGMFTIATGRVWANTESIVNELGIDIPCILCNGSVLVARNNSSFIESAGISIEELAPFMLEADSEGLAVLLCGQAQVRAMRRTPEVQLLEERLHKACETFELPFDGNYAAIKAQKLLIIGDMQKIKCIWDGYPPNLKAAYSGISSEVTHFEITPAGHDKGTALDKLMKSLNVSPSEVMCIGNERNDIPMLERAGVGVAVANSHPDLIEKAAYVCTKSFGEGVVEAIERFS